MPAFVIRTLGAPPRKVVVDEAPVRVGRDPSNEIVLPGDTVSREHAVFIAEGNGRWVVCCVSDTNPIVVNGAFVTTSAAVGEGSQVVIGAEAMIVVSENAFTASAYMGGQRVFEKIRCPSCSWTGLVSTARAKMACPRCTHAIASALAYAPDNEKGFLVDNAAVQDETNIVDSARVTALMERLNVSRNSRLDRADGRDDSRTTAPLNVEKTVTLAKTLDASLTLYGLLVFGSVSVVWEKERYVAISAMSFPSMKVNGASLQRAYLAHGDVIEIGSNRFRYVVTADTRAP